MPLLRVYQCCGQFRSTLDSDAVPVCGQCRGPMKWKQTRDYVAAAHVAQFGKAPALDYNQTRGRVAPIGARGVEVNSLNDIRRIERESEKMARDGVGEQYVFRKYQQDAGNLYTHTLGEAPDAAPSQEWLKKHAQLGDVPQPISDAEAEQAEFGPGMSADQPSAFGE